MNRPPQSPENGFLTEDQKVRQRLESRGVSNIKDVLFIDKETDQAGDKIEADICYLQLGVPVGEEFSNLKPVEGKLYLPQGQSNDELVIFTPGFPGGDSGRFEKMYAQILIKAGYSLFTSRYNGISLDGVKAEEIMNCPQRLSQARSKGEHHIGGTRKGGYSLIDLVYQPVVSTVNLQAPFKRLHYIGHSFGVAGHNISISRLAQSHQEITGKIGNILSIAGYIGGTSREGEKWDGLKMPMSEMAELQSERIRQKDVNFSTEPDAFRSGMQAVSELNEQVNLPDHIGLVMVYSPADHLIAGPDKKETYGPKKGRKLIIQDAGNLHDPEPHSMLWIKPKNLLRGLQIQPGEHWQHHLKLGDGKIVPLE